MGLCTYLPLWCIRQHEMVYLEIPLANTSSTYRSLQNRSLNDSRRLDKIQKFDISWWPHVPVSMDLSFFPLYWWWFCPFDAYFRNLDNFEEQNRGIFWLSPPEQLENIFVTNHWRRYSLISFHILLLLKLPWKVFLSARPKERMKQSLNICIPLPGEGSWKFLIPCYLYLALINFDM